MTTRERSHYQKLRDEYQESYSDPSVWGPIVSQFLKDKFKQTRIVGQENFETISARTIYVCAGYLGMGKNNYIVSHNSKYYYHETTISFRRENLPMLTLQKSSTKIVERHADVFKFWQKDTPEVLAKTYDTDFANSKLNGLIKDAGSQEDVREIFLKHYDFFKDVYLTLAINSSNFPYINS